MSQIVMLAERISTHLVEYGDNDVIQSTRRKMKWDMKEYLEKNDYLPVSEVLQWSMKQEGYAVDTFRSVEWTPGEPFANWALWVQILVQCEVASDV